MRVIERQADAAIRAALALPEVRGSEAAAFNALFRRLVTVGEDRHATKKRAYVVDWDAATSALKDELIRQRLLVASRENEGSLQRETVDIAHESILRSWPLLRAWVGEYHGAIRLLDEVTIAAERWAEQVRSLGREDADDALRRDPDLAERRCLLEDEARWRHERLEEVGAAMRQLGMVDAELSEDARLFILPEIDRLEEQLHWRIDHPRRDTIGQRLAALGDPRPGVGLRDGVPAPIWCATPGGHVAIHAEDDDRVLCECDLEPFYVSRYPVTVTQFRAFCDRDVYFDPRWWEGLPVRPEEHKPWPREQGFENQPAQFVSWYQAVAFSRWLSVRLRYDVRIPTECEWVQAACGGDLERRFPWGSAWDPDRANHAATTTQLVAVGLYPNGRSPVGADDLAGNMYEWCLNEFDHPTETAPSSRPRVSRGGAFFRGEAEASIRHRKKDNADGSSDSGGGRIAVCIRLVADLPDPGDVLAKGR